jgi:hypothetical protein
MDYIREAAVQLVYQHPRWEHFLTFLVIQQALGASIDVHRDDHLLTRIHSSHFRQIRTSLICACKSVLYLHADRGVVTPVNSCAPRSNHPSGLYDV